ncbi:transcription termination factor MTERF8, chloroplastic-like protein, partial [Tanacetum coccineum]
PKSETNEGSISEEPIEFDSVDDLESKIKRRDNKINLAPETSNVDRAGSVNRYASADGSENRYASANGSENRYATKRQPNPQSDLNRRGPGERASGYGMFGASKPNNDPLRESGPALATNRYKQGPSPQRPPSDYRGQRGDFNRENTDMNPRGARLEGIFVGVLKIADVVSADPRILTRLSVHSIERFSYGFKEVLGDKLYDSLSLESWEQKLDVFRGLGYTEIDIISTFRRFPNAFALSERKIKETVEFLLRSGRFDNSYIFKYPYVLIFSLDRRLKPRLRVLEILERENIWEFKPTTTDFSISDSKFFAKFVRPHLNKVKDI